MSMLAVCFSCTVRVIPLSLCKVVIVFRETLSKLHFKATCSVDY